MDDRDDVALTVVSAAKRRMLRRLRSHWRQEQFSSDMALGSAVHHSHLRVANMATQTDFVPAATYAATASPAATYAATLTLFPVIEHVVPALVATHAAPAPVFEYLAPAPVIEYNAPALAMTRAVPSQQLPRAYTMTTVTTDVNFDMVNPQFPITAVEASAPQVVGSLPLLEEFASHMYNRVHQEQIVATVACYFFKKFHRFKLWSGYRNKLLTPSKCFHMSVCNSSPPNKLCTCQSLRPKSRVPSPI